MENQLQDLLVGSHKEDFVAKVRELLQLYPYRFHWCSSTDAVLKTSQSKKISPTLTLIDAQVDTRTTTEWVQTAHMAFPDAPIVVIYNTDGAVDHKKVYKSGASRVIHIPFDQEFFTDLLLEMAPVDWSHDRVPKSALVAVDVHDLRKGTTIPFDLFLHLPANNRTLLLRKSGTTLDDQALQKLHKMPGQRGSIKKNQLRQFYTYATKILEKDGSDSIVSFTERLQRTKSQFQRLVSKIFDANENNYGHGKEILEHVDICIEEYGILDPALNKGQVYKIIADHFCWPRSIYNDSIFVSIFACLFGRILGQNADTCRNLAIAGFLHQIGLAGLPPHLVLKDLTTLTEDSAEIYKTHPIKALQMLKNKSVPLPAGVDQVIHQAFEHLDGTGYPHGHKNERICEPARILAIARKFQAVSGSLQNHRNVMLSQAFEKIMKENDQRPYYDKELLESLLEFFLYEEKLMNQAS